MITVTDAVRGERKRRRVSALQNLYDTLLDAPHNTPGRQFWDEVLACIRDCKGKHYHEITERRKISLLRAVVDTRHPPVAVVKAILEKAPSPSGSKLMLLHACCNEGKTPLFAAAENRTIDTRIVHLLAKDTHLLKKCDIRGLTPIHACIVFGKIDVLKVLLTFDPSAVLDDDQRGISRCLRLTEDLGIRTREGWMKFCLVIRCAHYGTVDQRSSHNQPILHATLALNCTAVQTRVHVFHQLLQSQAGVRDTKGYYPLHYGVKNRDMRPNELKRLVAAYPQAAKAPLPCCGNLPLMVALKHGQRDIRHILDAHTGAAVVPDAETGSLPLLFAAKHCNTGSIYKIMRAYPEALISLTQQTAGISRALLK